MKKLLVIAIVLGVIGGIIQDFRAPISLYFNLDDSSSYFSIALLLIFNSLFGICICLTNGFVEKSFQMIKVGALLGFIVGIISIPVRISLDILPLYIHEFIFMVLLGLFAGSIRGIVENSQKRILYGCTGGLIGGAVSVVGILVAVPISAGVMTIFMFFTDVIPDNFVFNIFTPAISGAFKSVSVWFFIALADNYYVRNFEQQT